LPENDFALLGRVAREAGAIARDFAERAYQTWRKSDGSPVTEADLAVNRFLNEKLRTARPDYAWLSEESEDDTARLSAKRTFVIDPIDGTNAFVKRLPHFTVCIGVVEDGRPVAGAVYNPMTDECFVAAKGEGAFLNGATIHVSERTELEGSRILAKNNVFDNPRFGWPELVRDNRDSSAYRLVLVANGAFDGTVSLTLKHDWDIAAAEIIVEEAGGIVTTDKGQGFRYNQEAPVQANAIAAGPALHKQLLAHLAR
jgi:myo-inositol-1(or 4)-monophosphatase